MKKLQKLNESKFNKFKSNEIENAHMVFGGQAYATEVVDSGEWDHLDDQCCNGYEFSTDGGLSWTQCDFTIDVTQPLPHELILPNGGYQVQSIPGWDGGEG